MVEGFSSDIEFVNAIQFLIDEKLILITPTSADEDSTYKIPSWIRTIVGYWVNNKTTEEELINAIQ